MPFEAGAFELVFLAMVALIVVGPKDLPILLRKVGQWTAKMRGLAAEFRASFDEMARQSELDELRKEVEALRTGQFMADTKAQLDTHATEINDHLSGNYWDASSHADPVEMYSDVSAAEGDEAAALPPPGARTKPLPSRSRKAAASGANLPMKASRKPSAMKPATAVEASPAEAPAPRRAPSKIANAAKAYGPPTAEAEPTAPPRPVKKAAAPRKPAAQKPTPNKPAPEAAEI